ncbi:MAG: hypothetical protein WCE83_10460 [Candidatus Baltobacteraceae bacterium]
MKEREVRSTFREMAEQAFSPELREIALVAASRGETLRSCARKMCVDHTTALQNLYATNPRPETILRWRKALEVSEDDTRALRVDAGARALTDDDLEYYRRRLLQSAALSPSYADAPKAARAIADAIDGLNKPARRSILHLVALETTRDAWSVEWPVGSQSVRKLREQARIPASALREKQRTATSDIPLWMLVDALRGVGYSTAEAREVGVWVTDALLRLGRVSQQTVDAWRSSLDADPHYGDEEHRALARRALKPSEESKA